VLILLAESETTLRNALTDNKTLKQRGARFGLDKCVMMEGGHGQREVSTRCMATTVEALVGAVHLDAGGGGAGYDAVRKVMEHLGFFDHEMLEGAQDVENVVMGGPVQSVA
jgi:dsRNA-specific ribonuclease